MKEMDDKEKMEQELAELKSKYKALQNDHEYLIMKHMKSLDFIWLLRREIDQKTMWLSEAMRHIDEHKVKPSKFVVELINDAIGKGSEIYHDGFSSRNFQESIKLFKPGKNWWIHVPAWYNDPNLSK